MNFDEYEQPRRTGAKRPARQRILVVTEGAVTERLYFEDLKVFIELNKNQLDVHVECAPSFDGNTPSRVVSSARKIRDEAAAKQAEQDKLGSLESREAYDEVWVVFDTEREGKNIDLKPAAESAQRDGIEVAISRPSFESWFLLHLREGLPGMSTCADVCHEISRITRSEFGRPYSKASKGNGDLIWLIRMILPLTETAVARGGMVEQTAFSTHSVVPDQSGTRVHALVKVLWNASRRGSVEASRKSQRSGRRHGRKVK